LFGFEKLCVRVQWLSGQRQVRLADCLVHGWVGVEQRRYILWVCFPVND
jgi:hypothetical protein